MKFTRITKIKGYRVFRDYSWPSDLHPFAQVNVIYGWNGSGKTTLASMFEHVERREPIGNGDVAFEFDGRTAVVGNDLATAALPAVRVFNRQFVEKTIASVASGVEHIYYFGEESVEKQEQVARLREELTRAQTSIEDKKKAQRKAEETLDKFCVDSKRSRPLWKQGGAGPAFEVCGVGVGEEIQDAALLLA